ncbi:MAG: NAD-dependent epimerase/dehydratase family protein [Actinobacteria bacterium]|nr:NAD-dependent epimerase/dehydratase family protein [Actinomycetota bacterium]
MGTHVIVGAGPVGGSLAELLLAQGEQVRVVTRSGSGIDGTERVQADATDATRLTEVTRGATAIYNCVNPPYHRWAQDWPPIAAALLQAAERSGAVLATTGNLYGYGAVDAPMTEQTPLAATGTKGRVRNQMWRDALAAHEAGRVRAFEVRGSDYLGGNSLLSTLITPALRKRRRAFVPADLDAPHTWTDVRDVAALLAVGAGDERAWGQAWHVPSTEPVSIRRLAGVAAEQLGAEPKLTQLPYAALWAVGLVNPFARELRETQHQFRRPFVLDSSAAERTFGLTPHPLADSVALDLANTPT